MDSIGQVPPNACSRPKEIMPNPSTKTWNQSEGSYMEITPGKCNGKNSSDASNIDSEEKVKVDAGISRVWREWQPRRHTGRRAGFCVSAPQEQEQEAGIRTRPRRSWRLRPGALGRAPRRLLAQRRTRCVRIVACSIPRQRGILMHVWKSGRSIARRRMKGRRCPKRAALAEFLGRCMARRWIHRAVSGMGWGRQSLQMDSLLRSCPILLWWPRGVISVAPFRALRPKMAAKPGGCDLIQ